MSNPLLADVDVLFGRNLEGTGFLKYANTARPLLGDIPLTQGSAERMDGANPSGDLSGKGDELLT